MSRVAALVGRALLVALAGWALLAWGAARSLVVEGELKEADAMVVLGGSAVYVERTQHAARLYREARAPRVILTDDGARGGWSSEEQRNPLFVERAVGELRRTGVPAERTEVLPRRVTSTYDEAVLLRDYATSHGLRTLLVVTSAYHSRRARWTFDHVFEGSGVKIGLAPAAPGAQTPPCATWWLSRSGWQFVAAESAKMVYYHWSY